jgi:hypothetical protein
MFGLVQLFLIYTLQTPDGIHNLVRFSSRRALVNKQQNYIGFDKIRTQFMQSHDDMIYNAYFCCAGEGKLCQNVVK